MTGVAADQPEVLTIEETARILRIGRNHAYALARQWLATGGARGLPVMRFGRSLRVSRPALQRLLEDGAMTTSAAP